MWIYVFRKDMLVLKQFQDKPIRRQKLMSVYNVKAEGKNNNPDMAEDLNQKEELRYLPNFKLLHISVLSHIL